MRRLSCQPLQSCVLALSSARGTCRPAAKQLPEAAADRLASAQAVMFLAAIARRPAGQGTELDLKGGELPQPCNPRTHCLRVCLHVGELQYEKMWDGNNSGRGAMGCEKFGMQLNIGL